MSIYKYNILHGPQHIHINPLTIGGLYYSKPIHHPYNKYQIKLSELHKDCLYHNFCPICTNSLTPMNDNPYSQYSFCQNDLFFIDKEYFTFKINGVEYTYDYLHDHIYSYFNDKIRFKDIIIDIDNLTLIQLYNNLTKFVTFQ